ncbi:hypothetical protein PIB30_063601 [Stylosanthes scabra]|uniref:Uncharacterized protein n=1 Tax=Stylosanthes scabra TaxID=79078 RepID=A0ABU6VN73_9FABA|nr:hypothetical protein [Stylosanthes scabra]
MAPTTAREGHRRRRRVGNRRRERDRNGGRVQREREREAQEGVGISVAVSSQNRRTNAVLQFAAVDFSSELMVGGGRRRNRDSGVGPRSCCRRWFRCRRLCLLSCSAAAAAQRAVTVDGRVADNDCCCRRTRTKREGRLQREISEQRVLPAAAVLTVFSAAVGALEVAGVA